MSNLNQYAPLRFITAGSVDDGKSTLIGRLLYDSKALLSDQLLSLNKSKNAGEVIDFSILTDGLEAEREQGITIDVAYRYFSTAKRKFIIADTPGHEQYTRNMVTGASTANAAVVLIDASQLDFSRTEVELLPQTKRHSAILKHLNTPYILVAVNKMDLLGFDVAKFEAITTAYCKLADQLGIQQVQFVPVSALQGDNIVHKSERTPWYAGEPLLTILENLPSNENLSERAEDFHFPVQLVSRLDQDKADDFRGYQGRIEAGSVSVGDTIRIEPNGYTSTVSEIISPNGIVQKAVAGEQVTIRLADDIDISRGDTFVAQHSLITATKRLTATVCWFDQRALNPARKYLLKHTTQTVFAKVTAVDHVLDVKTLSNSAEADSLKLNDIGELQLSLQKPITATTYAQNLSTGSFILIDEATYHTVAAGMILATE
ncbi:sulfate adenylyltransferase subunit 1 [Actinobacillus pleuropneumoniae]|uniref:sulfate adenylyltransferase n=1 Tax=Actinobacillus pleuropneumoniae serotype 3 (strain JL03) TaxID=434271 RepID=B0BT19_ACTPJ|nr:GTP-binding protein [Actinobacillus pleuropneumoniae]ABY70433.1 sulfate adenylate transferase subunit 1 [Actinobacillus pleuropneumoniae serovar 3 str. JL03]UKH15343.1 sulfate adenylyltransferase [Actinobacillus pleuropneumoniae]UKH20958.1 sulfate adenylyltransferase [Actinobacillus pleuropneumoniae]UKH44521.1 sulfate adenylyltransferase [Actinobacillus pleuropneumoniae]UPA20705.1 50S ribosome-binding GTPase [Actinobacillus pleuropneumoniae]